MNPIVRASQRVYRGLARSFPHEFRVVCGDGLEKLADDIAPIVWRDAGVLGLLGLLGNLALRLPIEHIHAWTGTLKELTMTSDPFEGTWKARNDKSQWDPKHTPEQACIRFEATDTGYLLVAYGIKDGELCLERPTSIVADGRRRPVVDLNGRPVPGVPPGALAFGAKPSARTLQSGVEIDGKTLSAGTFEVSDDGAMLTVTSEGMGLKGPIKVKAVFERVVPDPYTP